MLCVEKAETAAVVIKVYPGQPTLTMLRWARTAPYYTCGGRKAEDGTSCR